MKTKTVMQIKERADRAYGLICAFDRDKTQSTLVQAIVNDAKVHIGCVINELNTILDRRAK